MPTSLISKFDLNDFALSGLLMEVSCFADLIRQERVLTQEDYQKIFLLSDILESKSRDFKTGENQINEYLFFWKFYEEKIEDHDSNKSRKLYADKLLMLSQELLSLTDSSLAKLSKEKIREVGDTCAKLSKETREYWASQHPDGFKKY